MQLAHANNRDDHEKSKTTSQLLRVVAGSDQDFEWYPTTSEMIGCIKSDIDKKGFDYRDPSVLDCGAGDGRLLKALTKGSKYAIEKSRPLIDALDRKIYIVGTEFMEQTLIDKTVDIVVSNPPYSAFEAWATKIIREANATLVYLIIPDRWSGSDTIKEAIKARNAKTKVIGNFDFLNAERAARAKVEIVCVNLGYDSNYHRTQSPKIDPFTLWFEEHFKLDATQSELSKYATEKMTREAVANELKNELVTGGDVVATLVQLYHRDLAKLIGTYQALCDVDGAILQELDVNIEGVREAMKLKIGGLKNIYWQELFSNLHRVTDRLASKSRRAMLDKLSQHVHVDFTENNAHALLVWVIKNANSYFDEQLIDVVESLTEKGTIATYKSNQRTFGAELWRYTTRDECREKLTRYKIEYRIVLERVGGLATSSWNDQVKGLSQSAADLINDLRTVASNLNFNVSRFGGAGSFEWSGSDVKTLEYWDPEAGVVRTLFEVRAFKNGNLHIRFSQDYVMKLNVEFGRLKGWIKSPREAAKELDIPIEIAEQAFEGNHKLENMSALRLGFQAA